MSEFEEVFRLADLPEGTATRVELEGAEVCLVHTEGQVFAIDDVCSHAEVSLSEGEVDGCFIECWLHGSRFDLRTGEPVGPPAISPVPTYAVRVEREGEEATIYVALTQGARSTWQN